MRLIRIILSVAVMLAAVAAVPFAAHGEELYLRGDADGDREVTIIDATRIQRILSGLEKDPDGSQSMRGNVTGEELNILDATAIQRFLASIDNPFYVGSLSDVYAPLPGDDNQLPIVRR